MQLATCHFERKLQKCVRMGITVFKYFIWGGIWSDIRLEITFTAPLACSPKTSFPLVYLTIDLPK